MRLIFAGTPEFSRGVLEVLIKKHEIVGVYCQPDRVKGRGRVLSACPVKQSALAHNLPVFQPESLRDEFAQNQLKQLGAEIMVVVAYGQILPVEILDELPLGCLNIHASLLPRWRGAAPIQRAILAGDKITGISIMQMDAGLDTGAVLLSEQCEIMPADTAQTLHNKLAILGADLIVKTLENLPNLTARAQGAGATYAKKLSKNEAWIDWTQSAVQINRQIRAFNPYPIAQTRADSDKFSDKTLRILHADVVDEASDFDNHCGAGSVIFQDKKHCLVATGDGILNLKTVQLAGKKAVSILDFNNAYRLKKLTFSL